MQNSKNYIVILHISDLHFAHGDTEQDAKNQLYVFNRLQDLLSELEKDWKPELLCITGDITYKNRGEGYKQAITWINELLKILSIEKEGVFICPGNHEIDRSLTSTSGIVKLKGIADKKKPEKVDNILSIPISDHYKKLFESYERFCNHLGVFPYIFDGHAEYIIGTREYKGIRFICNNSCWFSYEKDEIWLGKHFLKHLLQKELRSNSPITIGLTHHPKNFYRNEEQYVYSDRHPPVIYLSDRCHLILTGHAHSRPGPFEKFAKARWFNAGCCGQSDQYRNNFTLFKVWPEKRNMDYCRYEWDGGQNKWIYFDKEIGYDFDSWIVKETDLRMKIEKNTIFKKEENEKLIQRDLQLIFDQIRDYVFSLDYTLAVKVFEDNKHIINSEYADPKILEEINLLISEAKDE